MIVSMNLLSIGIIHANNELLLEDFNDFDDECIR